MGTVAMQYSHASLNGDGDSYWELAMSGRSKVEHRYGVSTADVEGVAVYDNQGHKLGRIDHLVIDKHSGQVQAVVLVARGFLGLGHSHLKFPGMRSSTAACCGPTSPRNRSYIVAAHRRHLVVTA
jgi:hypothetical protein